MKTFDIKNIKFQMFIRQYLGACTCNMHFHVVSEFIDSWKTAHNPNTQLLFIQSWENSRWNHWIIRCLSIIYTEFIYQHKRYRIYWEGCAVSVYREQICLYWHSSKCCSNAQSTYMHSVGWFLCIDKWHN